MEIRWGLIPDMTGSQQLRRLVRLDVAKELTFTGREVSGVEAVDIGLATLVASSPRDAALELARKLAARSPQALRADKRLFAEDWEGSVADGLRLEEELQRSLIGTMNQSEAVEANFEKRPPVFQDPS
jgi:enoyl-CoA hydratase/carnithine racemase